MSEKAKVLQMIKDGKITVDEGMDLLDALGETEIKERESRHSGLADRFLRVRVDNAKSKVNVNIPLRLLTLTSKLVNIGLTYIP